MTRNTCRPPQQARTGSDTESANRLELLRELLQQNYGEIGRADSKAGVLLAMTGSLLGLLLAGHERHSAWSIGMWWAAASASTSAFLALLLAILPRHSPVPGDDPEALAYFGDVLRATRNATLSEAVGISSTAPTKRLLRALEGTSRIAHIKNLRIRLSIALLVPALTAALAALLPL